MTGHVDRVNSVAFSPDGKTVVSGSWDKNVRLWDAQSGAPIGNSLTGHGNGVDSVAFSPDSKTVASGNWDKNVRLWNVSPKNWLWTACQQLQYHPLLTNPTTDVAQEAKQTCEKYAYKAPNQDQPSATHSTAPIKTTFNRLWDKLTNFRSPSSPTTPSAVTPSATTNPFSEAVNQVTQAANLTQTAQTPEQWSTVANHWQQAITHLQTIPTTAPNHTTAQQKIGEYSEEFALCPATALALTFQRAIATSAVGSDPYQTDELSNIKITNDESHPVYLSCIDSGGEIVAIRAREYGGGCRGDRCISPLATSDTYCVKSFIWQP